MECIIESVIGRKGGRIRCNDNKWSEEIEKWRDGCVI
jgi:hypothetical protein